MASPLSVARSARKVAHNVAGKRLLSDISITRTGKPIIRIEGGRSSLGGHTATVFGATGQLGRYIVNRLARQGCTVVVPFREEMTKRHLKVTGDLGRIVFVEYDLHNTASIEASVRHSDIVLNLIGRDYPTKNFSLEDVHVESTERIVEAVAKYDVDRYIHVSSHNADSKSSSEFYATKGRGEEVARSIFPETTLVRPAPVFGFEDNLLLKLAGVTNLFTSNNMQQTFWPVHSIDVGAALEKITYDDSTAGQTFELYGPLKYSMRQIANMVDKEIYNKRRHLNVPKALLKPIAGVLNQVLWWHTMSSDEIEREFMDQVIDPHAKTFKDLDIEPGDIANFTYHYLQGFRSQNYYDLPPATDKEKREEKNHALAALAEFHAEKDAHQQTFEKLRTGIVAEDGPGPGDEAGGPTAAVNGDEPLSMAAFVEDWNESQFWYLDDSAAILAEQLLHGASSATTIGVLSTPSVFVALKNIVRKQSAQDRPKLVLFEHDDRFNVFPEFVFYDYQQPFKLPGELKGTLDCIIIDPPFFNNDCQTKFALTAKWLLKPTLKPGPAPRVVVCTGERMASIVLKLYRSLEVNTTTFEPAHAGLSNHYYCYANFESPRWTWRPEMD
ncbi:NADH-ubiquinone oxidoreductase subunit, mitochondrial [Neonectria ditissima]|uniref:Protein-lysine N-methyltransferase EFM5 n=1 Tax=Neonectria ditissima TaxID=78410 RepID=A0A0N8H6C0_9HYPO|nr:NADH-ubiquinone oxidoreductase subunit, mitochondrial [Neonectria ditissima]